MYRRIQFLGSVLIFSHAAFSQAPVELLDRWSASTPIEKVYLHFDRENYIAGETIWFKAYTWSDYQPDTISTSLFVELVQSNGTRIGKAIVPIILGVASGQLVIPDSLSSGNYMVRAFSPTMLNIDPAFTGRQTLFIYGRQAMNHPAPEKKIRLEFFPEGGNLITGYTNTVAFKATKENGLPLAAKGRIINEKNEEVSRFASFHDGMGLFELNPVAGERYYAVAEDDAMSLRQYLPGQTTKGIAVVILPHPQGHFFEVQQIITDPQFRVAYMIGQMQHHSVFRQDFKNSKETFQGVINTQKLHSGILEVTFFNSNDQPLAERLCFVNNKEYILPGELFTDSLNFSERARNRFAIQLNDTVRGNFSVSVSDAEYLLNEIRDENIYSSLLLSSDLKGYIHRPSYYFSADNDSVRTALDLLMMTNGWRRFNWTELSQKSNQPAIYKDPSYITISGKITSRESKKPFAERPLLLMLITADSTRSIQMITTDKQGNFRIDSMLFFGPSRLFFSDIRGKKSQYIDVQLSGDTLSYTYSLMPIPKQTIRPENEIAISYGSKIDLDYDAIKKAKGLMLEGVTVKARRKTPIEELEEKYVSGMFASEDNKVFDLVNTKETETYANIFDYLQYRVSGLSIIEPDYQDFMPVYKLYYRQSATLSSMGPIPVILYLNEVETDAFVIATLPSKEIAMIKLFSDFGGAAGAGAGGVLAIYTKKGSDLADAMQSTSAIASYNGYSVVKEFYSPDYTIRKPGRETDKRITLEWRPDIRLNNVNPRIPITFFNNDRTKSYKVVIEGMTFDGKMLMIEKVIKP